MKCYVICIYCIYSSHIITPLMNSLLYSCVTYRQVKEMVTLNLFIESHYKYIVSIIRVSTSLLFTCPQLTAEFSPLLAAAARTWLLLNAHVMQYISAW